MRPSSSKFFQSTGYFAWVLAFHSPFENLRENNRKFTEIYLFGTLDCTVWSLFCPLEAITCAKERNENFRIYEILGEKITKNIINFRKFHY